ncbi:general secretion pathway protein GspB [Massilia sp. SR12]
MSYILEALKKAQAERQIGSTPTIHAPTLASAPQGQGPKVRRAPVMVAMVLMVAAIAGLATMLVRQQSSAGQPPVAAVGAGATVAATPAHVPLSVAPTTSSAAAQAALPAPDAVNTMAATSVSAPTVAPMAPAAPDATAKPAPAAAAAAAPASAAAPTAAARQAPNASAAPVSATSAAAAVVPARTPEAVAAPAPRAADAAPAAAVALAPAEEHIQSLHELPEPIQRAIPPITLGGYMYSKNPADRLLLIDKALRKEGEEVAPGLLLEKLQPKQAVFRFRGYRYKVPL